MTKYNYIRRSDFIENRMLRLCRQLSHFAPHGGRNQTDTKTAFWQKEASIEQRHSYLSYVGNCVELLRHNYIKYL